MVALRPIGAHAHQGICLTDVLDAFCHDAQSQRVSQVDDGLDDHFIGQRTPDAGDETLIDLHGSDRQLAKIRQRRVSGAEVVQRQLGPQLSQRRQDTDCARQIFQQTRLGHLEPDAARTDTTRIDRRCDLLAQMIAGRQLLGGEVHPHPHRRTVPSGLPPAGQFDRRLEHPVADRHHHPGGLGVGQEGARGQQPVVGVLPAKQRLDADDCAVVQIDLRLHEQSELVVCHCAT